jgi:serine-type D-Ala-D-Ala carboxypeptidase/endopeptidase (penicillin-binding protein 4)
VNPRSFVKHSQRCILPTCVFVLLGFWAHFLFCATVDAQETNQAPQTLSELQQRIAAHLDQPRFAQAQWGVKIVSLDSGKIVFERNADKLLKPASNAKMFTAALALDRLGEDYRVKTSFYSASLPDSNGVLKADLIAYGRGDPCFSARFNDGDYEAALAPAVDAIVAAGIKQIAGDLVGDDSYFAGPPFGSDWAWDDLQNYYGAEVSALTYQDNVIDLIFKPGKEMNDICQIVTHPETSFVTFSNRTVSIPAGGRGRVRIYRPLGENTAYISGTVPLDSKGESDAVAVHNPALQELAR